MPVIFKGLEKHPCFNNDAHGIYGRIHLPVAENCNISCNYCDRNYHCVNQSRPGVTRKLMTPAEAIEYLKINDTLPNKLTVVGIAGPGEPLYNEETFETLRLVKKEFPRLIRCISTNGMLLSDKISHLQKAGISSVTLTLNTLRVETAVKIYSYAGILNKNSTFRENVELFLHKQQQGLSDTVKAGITLKLNMVLIPGINDGETEEIASFAKENGVSIMNVMPLIPQGKLKHVREPDFQEVKKAKLSAGKYLTQLDSCGRCRADAVGLICGNISQD